MPSWQGAASENGAPGSAGRGSLLGRSPGVSWKEQQERSLQPAQEAPHPAPSPSSQGSLQLSRGVTTLPATGSQDGAQACSSHFEGAVQGGRGGVVWQWVWRGGPSLASFPVLSSQL